MNKADPDSSAPAVVEQKERSVQVFATDEEIQAYKAQMEALTSGKAMTSVAKVRNSIANKPSCHEQLPLSFMPTPMTRTSPFFPMSKKAMADRPFEQLKWETSWGQMSVSGHLTPSSQVWQGMAYTPLKRRRSYAGRFPSA